MGELGSLADGQRCQDILRLASATGPFRADLDTFQEAACKFLGVRRDDLLDTIKVLEDAGVLLRRGRTLRVTPDVLADHVLEEACFARDGSSTGYAERVHVRFKDVSLPELLQNLGELDWRRNHRGTAPAGARLLRGIWNELEDEFRAANGARKAELLRLVKVAAFHQPEAALRFRARIGPPPLGKSYQSGTAVDVQAVILRPGHAEPASAPNTAGLKDLLAR